MKLRKIKALAVSVCLIFALSLVLYSCRSTMIGGNDGSGNNTNAGSAGNSGNAGTPEISADVKDMDFTFSNRDSDDGYSAGDAVKIVFSDSGSSVTGNGASADGKNVTITEAGTYIVSGSASDASLTVSAGTEDKIQLVLCGLSLTNPSGPALYIGSADKVFITLDAGSVNTLSDGESYAVTDGDTNLDAALFSREDLTINGTGSLTVNGNYKHGIVSKDDLVITDGKIDVTSVNVGLNGKDCVKISGGDIIIDAGTDGIRSDNDEDSARGYVYVCGGTLNIVAGNDGIQAETLLKIDDGSFIIKTGGGSANASTNSSGSFNPGWGGWGVPGGSSGSIGTSSGESAKGLKATAGIVISGGNFDIDSSDDSCHSNGTIEISGGDFDILSGDDGMHADTALSISDGNVTISKSYEGIESSDIRISGGKISVVASDDGINASGGNDSSGLGGRPGQGMFSSSTGIITISGGYVLVNASGDGIDSNGSLSVSGGVVLVSGSTNSGNGAFDYDSSAKVTGGVVVALGSSGMAQNFSSAENQGSMLITFNSQNAGTPFALCDENGKVIVSFTPTKAYNCAVVTA
ncbi:MAG: carbohydrate-binding domain-containing protein, partial [Clostridiales bacterium]|nr:carbohydrate-binding domain-containing protein [Clostridiales bacterium]